MASQAMTEPFLADLQDLVLSMFVLRMFLFESLLNSGTFHDWMWLYIAICLKPNFDKSFY